MNEWRLLSHFAISFLSLCFPVVLSCYAPMPRPRVDDSGLPHSALGSPRDPARYCQLLHVLRAWTDWFHALLRDVNSEPDTELHRALLHWTSRIYIDFHRLRTNLVFDLAVIRNRDQGRDLPTAAVSLLLRPAPTLMIDDAAVCRTIDAERWRMRRWLEFFAKTCASTGRGFTAGPWGRPPFRFCWRTISTAATSAAWR